MGPSGEWTDISSTKTSHHLLITRKPYAPTSSLESEKYFVQAKCNATFVVVQAQYNFRSRYTGYTTSFLYENFKVHIHVKNNSAITSLSCISRQPSQSEGCRDHHPKSGHTTVSVLKSSITVDDPLCSRHHDKRFLLVFKSNNHAYSTWYKLFRKPRKTSRGGKIHHMIDPNRVHETKNPATVRPCSGNNFYIDSSVCVHLTNAAPRSTQNFPHPHATIISIATWVSRVKTRNYKLRRGLLLPNHGELPDMTSLWNVRQA